MKLNSLREKAYIFMRDAIVSNRLRPGEVLNEKVLSEELKTSKTPVREAIQFLHKEGLVNIIPQRGALVSYVTVEDISEILQIREILEPFAAGVAALNHDPSQIARFERNLREYQDGSSKNYTAMSEEGKRFHKYLIGQTRNQRLINILGNVNLHMDRIRAMFCYLVPPGYNEQALEEHLTIIEALKTRDRGAAEGLMKKHIQHYRDVLRKVV